MIGFLSSFFLNSCVYTCTCNTCKSVHVRVHSSHVYYARDFDTQPHKQKHSANIDSNVNMGYKDPTVDNSFISSFT